MKESLPQIPMDKPLDSLKKLKKGVKDFGKNASELMSKDMAVSPGKVQIDKAVRAQEEQELERQEREWQELLDPNSEFNIAPPTEIMEAGKDLESAIAVNYGDWNKRELPPMTKPAVETAKPAPSRPVNKTVGYEQAPLKGSKAKTKVYPFGLETNVTVESEEDADLAFPQMVREEPEQDPTPLFSSVENYIGYKLHPETIKRDEGLTLADLQISIAVLEGEIKALNKELGADIRTSGRNKSVMDRLKFLMQEKAADVATLERKQALMDKLKVASRDLLAQSEDEMHEQLKHAKHYFEESGPQITGLTSFGMGDIRAHEAFRDANPEDVNKVVELDDEAMTAKIRSQVAAQDLVTKAKEAAKAEARARDREAVDKIISRMNEGHDLTKDTEFMENVRHMTPEAPRRIAAAKPSPRGLAPSEISGVREILPTAPTQPYIRGAQAEQPSQEKPEEPKQGSKEALRPSMLQRLKSLFRRAA